MLLATEALFNLASFARGAVSIDIGPSTGDYLAGFSDSEERLPATFRWTGEKASIDLPLVVASGPGTLVIRYARFIDEPVRVRVYLAGRPAASFIARPGRFRTQRFPVSFPEGPVRIDFLTENPAPPRLGIALDWVRLEGGQSFLPHSAFNARLLVPGVFIISWWLGFGVLGSLAMAFVLSCSQALWFGLDPFGLAHVTAKTAVVGVILTAASAGALRFADRRPETRWIPLIFLLGYVLKGAGIFYPSYFYPDVRNHRRYVYAFAEAEGSIPERGLAAQLAVRTAYPRRIGGKVYALPYSPLFFVPFTWLPDDVHLVDEALKHVALVMGATEVIVVYWLAALLVGSRAGLAAALLAAFLPPMYSRLFLAMWPTVAGHLLDCLAITTAAFWAAHPERPRRLAAFAGLSLSSALLYISSLFNLSAFVTFLSLVERRLAVRALVVWAAAALTAILALYLSFTSVFFREIVPSLLSSPTEPVSGSFLGGMVTVLRRVVLFYGYGYPALAVAGLVLAHRRTEKLAFRMLSAYWMAFLILCGLRAVPGGLFKDLKEILFVGPLVAISAGIALETLASRGRSGKWSAALIVAGLVFFWWGGYRGYLTSYASLAGLD